MAKKILVVKADGTQHVVEETIKPQILAQNNLLPDHLKWKITEVDESAVRDHAWKAVQSAVGNNSQIIQQKDKEIEDLKKKLAALEAKGETPAPEKTIPENPAGNAPVVELAKDLDWRLAVAKIKELSSVGDVDAFVAGDDRPSVISAADKRKEELKAA